MIRGGTAKAAALGAGFVTNPCWEQLHPQSLSPFGAPVQIQGVGGFKQSQAQAANRFSLLISQHRGICSSLHGELPLLSCCWPHSLDICGIFPLLPKKEPGISALVLNCCLIIFVVFPLASKNTITLESAIQCQTKNEIQPAGSNGWIFPSVPWTAMKLFYVKLVQFCSFSPLMLLYRKFWFFTIIRDRNCFKIPVSNGTDLDSVGRQR